MPLDSSAERVQEPPTEEASEATLKKQPEGRPELRVVAPPEEATLEVSPAAKETFSDQAKETVAGLQPESKGFVGKLYEKVKSSEVVQNVVDRYQVWRNDKLAGRAENKIGQLTQEQRGHETGVQSATETAGRVEANFMKTKQTLEAMGRTISSETEDKVRQEIEAHQARADEARTRVQIVEGRIQDVKDLKEAYDARVNEARGHLDGRLEAKQQINNEALRERGEKLNQLDSWLDQGRKSISELDSQAKQLRALMGSVDKSLQAEIASHLEQIQAKQTKYAERVKLLKDRRVEVQKKIKELEGKNADLQAKRDKIFPPKEKPAEPEKPAEKPTGYEVNEGVITMSFGGGRELRIADGKISDFKPDGETEEVNLDDADDTTLDYLTRFSAATLEKVGASPKVTARVEELRTARKAEKEKAPKFLAGDIVAAWNQEVDKGSGLRVNLEKGADPKKDLGSEVAAKEMLLALLAKKINKGDVKNLNNRVKGKVENFFTKYASRK